MAIAWNVRGLSHRPAITALRPASIRFAIATSPSRESKLTEPIPRKYNRTVDRTAMRSYPLLALPVAGRQTCHSRLRLVAPRALRSSPLIRFAATRQCLCLRPCHPDAFSSPQLLRVPAPGSRGTLDHASLPRGRTVASVVHHYNTRLAWHKSATSSKGPKDLGSPSQWLFAVDQGIMTHNFATAAPRFNSNHAAIARKARRRFNAVRKWRLLSPSIRSTEHERNVSCRYSSRQRRRPSSAGAQEENAARRRFSRDET
jgi:hypothetical protein